MKKQTVEFVIKVENDVVKEAPKQDRRKSEYLDRPLTDTEKEFAAMPENHDLIYKYMRQHRLDLCEWYDILIMHYLRAVKKYCSIEKLQRYEFVQILYRTLDNGRSCYYRDMNRQKRMPEGGFINLDYETDNINNFGTHKIDAVWIDNRQNTEQEIIDQDFIIRIMENLDEFQQQIFNMMMEGFSKVDISKHMGITLRVLDNRIKCMREIIKNYLSEMD